MIFIAILIMIMAIAIPSINKNISYLLFTRITSIILIYAGALSLNALYFQSIGSGIAIYSGYFNVSSVTQFFDFFIFVLGSFILISFPYFLPYYTMEKNGNSILDLGNGYATKILNSRSMMRFSEKNESDNLYAPVGHVALETIAKEYSLIILFSLLGSTFLISSSDLISIYLSIELQSFGVYILASLFKNSVSATGAGLKYFLLGGLSSCLILLGIGLIYSYTGLTNLDSLYSFILTFSNNTENLLNNNLIFGLTGNEGFSLGLIIIIVGFLFKISAAPLHNWLICGLLIFSYY